MANAAINALTKTSFSKGNLFVIGLMAKKERLQKSWRLLKSKFVVSKYPFAHLLIISLSNSLCSTSCGQHTQQAVRAWTNRVSSGPIERGWGHYLKERLLPR